MKLRFQEGRWLAPYPKASDRWSQRWAWGSGAWGITLSLGPLRPTLSAEPSAANEALMITFCAWYRLPSVKQNRDRWRCVSAAWPWEGAYTGRECTGTEQQWKARGKLQGGGRDWNTGGTVVGVWRAALQLRHSFTSTHLPPGGVSGATWDWSPSGKWFRSTNWAILSPLPQHPRQNSLLLLDNVLAQMIETISSLFTWHRKHWFTWQNSLEGWAGFRYSWGLTSWNLDFLSPTVSYMLAVPFLLHP